MNEQPSCEECIEEEMAATFELIQQAIEDEVDPVDWANDCVLCFQQVFWKHETFYSATRYVIQVQLSWGGPADGFIFELGSEGEMLTAFYYFQNWNDYAQRRVSKRQLDLLDDLLGELFLWGTIDLAEFAVDCDGNYYEEE